MRDRNVGIDIYRILCCIGVLAYHVIDDVLFVWGGVFAKALYYGASFCVPGFFLLAGYLISKKKKLTIEYCEEKILNIALKLFGWIIFWTAIHFIRTGEILDLWDQYLQVAGSGGILPVAWFLFTYEVLILISFPLYHLLDLKYGKYYLYIINALLLILLACGFGHNWIKTKTQSLWFHIYFTYYITGMVIYRIEEMIPRKIKNNLTIIAIISCIASTLIYFHIVDIFGGFPHTHYGKWYYSIWLVSFFIVVLSCSRLNISKKIKKIIMLLASNTFTIYLGHIPILLLITERRPLKGVLDAIACIVFLFFILQLMAELFKRMPLLRKIV